MKLMYAVVSPRQRELKNGYHFMNRTLSRAITEAVIIAKRRKQRMHVIIIKR
jgi:hypothetical protein